MPLQPPSEAENALFHKPAGEAFYGKKKKFLAYVNAIMNMIPHGIEALNIAHTSTLSVAHLPPRSATS